jgi:AcrR family transcriptional regulator
MVMAGETAVPQTMRARILRAAGQVIRDKGLARATTKEIAEAAQCSEGSLYRHFDSKEDLFLAVLSEQLPAFLPALHELTSRIGKGTVAANLERVGMAALAFFDESIPMFASVFAEPTLLAQHSEWMRTTDTGPHRAVVLVADYLRGEQALRRVHADVSAEEAAAMLLGACYLRSFTRQSNPAKPISDQRFIRRLLATLFAGLTPPAA